MSEENMTVDPQSGNKIRRTDNTPKEEDIFLKANQVTRPLTKEEIADLINEYGPNEE